MSGTKKTQYIHDFKKAKWNIFRFELNAKLRNFSSNLSDVTCKEHVNTSIDDFTKSILEAVEKSVPKITKDFHTVKLPPHILKLIKVRNSYRRHWQKYRQTIFKDQVSLLNKVISKNIFLYRNIEWNKKLESLEKNSKLFWNISKVLKNKNRHLPFLKDESNYFFTDVEKANALASNFAKNHQLSINLGDRDTNVLVHSTVSSLIENNNEPSASDYVTVEDIEFIISELKLRKAAGLDTIRNQFLKELPKKALMYLTFVINACIKLEFFPNAWKDAKVIPIVKAGKAPENVNSYRPISLLSSLGKIYEKVLKLKISNIISESNIYPNEQFGFRQYHSTSHQVLRICNHIKTNRTSGRSTGMILLDIEKAFDTVWHEGLIYKMINFNFPAHLCKIIYSFLSGRSFKVHVNDCVSNVVKFGAGVPQGSVLGPVLYNLFTSDLPIIPNCDLAIFADDTAIFSSHEFALDIERNLQNAIKILNSYYTKWKIKLNHEKIQAIFFTRKRKSCFLPSSQLEVNGCYINWEPSVKYLGITLDKKLTFSEHTSNTLKKVSIAIRILYPLINRKSLLSKNNKIIILKVIFQAILLYGCQVWGKCAMCHIKKLQVSQNKVLKMMLSLPWHHSTLDAHQKANVELISERIKKLNRRFIERCTFADNPLVNESRLDS